MWVVKKCFNLLKLEQLYDNKKLPEQNVITYLRLRNPRLKSDSYGNLYLINPWTPILNAHMDTVQKFDDTVGCTKKLKIKRDKISAKNCIIWWDDKCWIAIAMQIYEEVWDKVSLLFTRQEEVGCIWIWRVFTDDELTKLIEQAPYALTLDRRSNGDIIGYDNGYCSKEFENRIAEITKPYGYKPAKWLCSDANHICKHINCVNLSVGYYNPHSKQEYVDCKDLINSLEAIKEIINTIKSTEQYEIYTTPYQYPKYSSIYDYGNSDYSYPNKSLFDYGHKDFFSWTDSKKASTPKSDETKPTKEWIKKLLEYFDYDIERWVIKVKKNIELYNIVWAIDDYDIVDIYKWQYYVDDLEIIGDDEDDDEKDKTNTLTYWI